MVAINSIKLSIWFCTIPSICQKIDFTRNREAKGLEHVFNESDFGLEGIISIGSSGVIEFGQEGQKWILIKQKERIQ